MEGGEVDPLIGCTLCGGKPVRYWRDSFPHPRGGTVMAAGYCDRCAGRFDGEGLVMLEEPLRRSQHDARLRRFRPEITTEKEGAAAAPIGRSRFNVLKWVEIPT